VSRVVSERATKRVSGPANESERLRECVRSVGHACARARMCAHVRACACLCVSLSLCVNVYEAYVLFSAPRYTGTVPARKAAVICVCMCVVRGERVCVCAVV